MIINPISIDENLIFGNASTIPSDAQMTICCSTKIFNDMLNKPLGESVSKNSNLYYSKTNPNLFWINDNRLFAKVYDEENDEIDADLVMRVLKILYEQLPGKKIYLYNEVDETDALAIVFIYLVIKHKIEYSTPDDALNVFYTIAPGFAPTPEWIDFIYDYFPFDAFLLN